jgi:hypothetical protein
MLVAAAGAQAQVAGTWFGGLGLTRISPNTSSGALSPPAAPNTQVDLASDTQPALFIGRMLTDHWAVQVPIGLGFEHDINGAGAISGVGKIGSVHVLPISAFGEYYFLEPSSRFRPYALAGITYAHFYGERGSATLGSGHLTLAPDAGEIVLVSPGDLGLARERARAVVLGLPADARVRSVEVQAQSGGTPPWRTLARFDGSALAREGAGSVVPIPSATGAPIDRLRIVLRSEATRPFDLARVAVLP